MWNANRQIRKPTHQSQFCFYRVKKPNKLTKLTQVNAQWKQNFLEYLFIEDERRKRNALWTFASDRLTMPDFFLSIFYAFYKLFFFAIFPVFFLLTVVFCYYLVPLLFPFFCSISSSFTEGKGRNNVISVQPFSLK